MDRMRGLGWTLELDSFEDKTPLRKKWFHNIIATNNMEVCNRVVIACHYDSKNFPDFEFIGATDAAVPCALIIHLAARLSTKLVAHSNYVCSIYAQTLILNISLFIFDFFLTIPKNIDPTLQFLFFDGEEALVKWSGLFATTHTNIHLF